MIGGVVAIVDSPRFETPMHSAGRDGRRMFWAGGTKVRFRLTATLTPAA